jgi:hypothetical protein
LEFGNLSVLSETRKWKMGPAEMILNLPAL